MNPDMPPPDRLRPLTPCEHDFEPLQDTMVTKMMILGEMAVGGCQPLVDRFRNVPVNLFIKVCLNCKTILDEREEFKEKINQAIEEMGLLKTWEPLRRKRAKDIYITVMQMQHQGAA